jgi:signal transduction histidine kinase
MISQIEEENRIKALKEYNVLDTLPEEIFDDITLIASSICHMPIATISLVDGTRQFFKSKIGIDFTETPIEHSVCYQAILSKEEIFEVPDLRMDDRFKESPLVSEAPNLVSYYGVPLASNTGIVFGMLCVVSSNKVQEINEEQKQTLKKLAKQIIYILELRKRNEELTVYHVKLSKYAAEMESFAYTAAHDLRSPIRAITSFLQLIEARSTSADEKNKNYFKIIFDSVKRLDRLIVDLLDYAKSNKKVEDNVSVNIDLLVSTIFEGLRGEYHSTSPQLVKHNLPVLSTSKVAIHMIFNNLIDNALKYQKEGHAAVITVNYQEEPQAHVFEVIDNGIGIETEFLELIFKPFKRLHTQAAYPGSGLGLAAVMKMIESINGTITVRSTPDEGSVFVFSIPK